MLRPNSAGAGVAENQSRQAMAESSLRRKLLFGTVGCLTSLRERAKEKGRRQSIQNAPHATAKKHSGMTNSQAKTTAAKIQKSFTCSIAYLNARSTLFTTTQQSRLPQLIRRKRARSSHNDFFSVWFRLLTQPCISLFQNPYVFSRSKC